MTTGGVRAFLRRGKFVPDHSELQDFLLGRITREEGMAHIRRALRFRLKDEKRLREETLKDLRAWDLVYLDHLADGRLIPGEKTAACEPLHGLTANEALLVRQAAPPARPAKRARKTRAPRKAKASLLSSLPALVRRSLQARVKKMAGAWERDAKVYDRLFPRARRGARKVARKPAAKKARRKAAARR